MKSWPTYLKWAGQTPSQRQILNWIKDNIEFKHVLNITLIDRNHIRLTDDNADQHLLTHNLDGSVTMNEIEEVC